MTIVQSTPEAVVWVAIDVAKDRHEVLIEAPGWRSRSEFVSRTERKNFAHLQSSFTALDIRSALDLSPPATTTGLWLTSSTLRDSSCNSSLRWLWPALAKRCTTPGTRTIPKTPRSFFIF